MAFCGWSHHPELKDSRFIRLSATNTDIAAFASAPIGTQPTGHQWTSGTWLQPELIWICGSYKSAKDALQAVEDEGRDLAVRPKKHILDALERASAALFGALKCQAIRYGKRWKKNLNADLLRKLKNFEERRHGSSGNIIR